MRCSPLPDSDVEFVATALVATQPLAAPDSEGVIPPRRIALMPLGEMLAVDGRRWTLPPQAATAVIAASLASGLDLVIDFDHATEAKGVPAPAAGWMRGLRAESGYIVADVEWTPRGAAALAARDYRYVSPTFMTRTDGTVTRIVRAALVNSPALAELPALAGAGAPPQEDSLTTIETTPAAAPEVALASARQALGLAVDADAVTIATAITRLRDAETTLAAQVQQLTAQVTAQAAADADTQREALITAAVAEGKLAPALVPTVRGNGQVPGWSIEQIKAFLAAAPTIITAGTRADLNCQPTTTAGSLTDNERQVCAAMRLDPKAYIAARAAMDEGDDR